MNEEAIARVVGSREKWNGYRMTSEITRVNVVYVLFTLRCHSTFISQSGNKHFSGLLWTALLSVALYCVLCEQYNIAGEGKREKGDQICIIVEHKQTGHDTGSKSP
jgi:hypothetical protein